MSFQSDGTEAKDCSTSDAVAAQPAGTALKNYPTSLASRFVTLIGFAFLAFELCFLFLYGSNFWFSWDLSGLGIPAICLTMVLSHFLLTFLESPYAVSRLSFIFKGRPPVVYRKWLSVSKDGFSFGLRHVLFSAVDELELSFIGNLVVKSRALCGDAGKKPDIILKIPFGVAAQDVADQFLQTVKTFHPQVKLNKRLVKKGPMAKIRGAKFVQLLGPAFMFLILLDVGNTSFDYLQVIKGYYLCQLQALSGQMSQAKESFNQAERQSKAMLPVSYVRPKFFQHGLIAGALYQAKSQALWDMGDTKSALKSAYKAVDCQPTSLRHNLYCARLLSALGRERQARAEINRALDAHEDSFLPRLYMLASFISSGKKEEGGKFAQMSIDDLNEQVFVDEPQWPPGGDRFLNDLLYGDDIKFLLGRLTAPANEPKASGLMQGSGVKNH